MSDEWRLCHVSYAMPSALRYVKLLKRVVWCFTVVTREVQLLEEVGCASSSALRCRKLPEKVGLRQLHAVIVVHAAARGRCLLLSVVYIAAEAEWL